jgi:hypothetical protein
LGHRQGPHRQLRRNHATLLLKLLAFNLFRRFIADCYAALAMWRTAWLRRVNVVRAGRPLPGPGRSRVLRAQPIATPMCC